MLPLEENGVVKKEVVLLMVITIISNCLGNLGSDVVRSAFKSLSKNYQCMQQEAKTRYIARLRRNFLNTGPQT